MGEPPASRRTGDDRSIVADGRRDLPLRERSGMDALEWGAVDRRARERMGMGPLIERCLGPDLR